MTEIATKLVVDLSKGKNDPLRVQSIPLTEEELLQREQDAIAAEAAEAEREAEALALSNAKQAAQDKLKALGLTDLEIAAITGA